MAPSLSLLARLSTVLGRRGSRPTPPADFHFDLRLAIRPADGGQPADDRLPGGAEDGDLPGAHGRLDRPRNVQPGLDPYMAAFDRH
jgi:hypothetical protein